VSATALLQVRELTKRFGGLLAVSNLDFHLHQGEILGLIGPNGAGKSTTFNLIAGAQRATAGSMRFAGQAIDGLSPHQIAARGIMRTFQHNMPFAGMSVVENVMVGMHCGLSGRSGFWPLLLNTPSARQAERRAREKSAELVEFIGLAGYGDADVTSLSFGQGRLLETARALAGDPRLMLFDEPAAGLTSAECVLLAGIIRSIAERGIAVLLIEHDMHFLMPLAQRVVVLNFGCKIADGTPDAVRCDPAVADAYLGQAASFTAPRTADGTPHAAA
jgi:branched-chain amino acid transport system ATP-binding protein